MPYPTGGNGSRPRRIEEPPGRNLERCRQLLDRPETHVPLAALGGAYVRAVEIGELREPFLGQVGLKAIPPQVLREYRDQRCSLGTSAHGSSVGTRRLWVYRL